MVVKNGENLEFRPIHYLGSKLRILEEIKMEIDILDSSNRRFVDLFSGSGTVSRYISQYRDVTAVDIQKYSKVICEALLCTNISNIDIDKCLEIIITNCEKKYKTLNMFDELIEFETNAINNASINNISDLYDIVDEGSIICASNSISYKNNSLGSMLLMLNNILTNKTDDFMITRYFGGLYFSYKQAIMFDVLLNSIYSEDLPNDLQNYFLAILLSTCSETVNTIGKQFAQPLKVYDKNGKFKMQLLKKIMNDRSIDVIKQFKNVASSYRNHARYRKDNAVLCMDYIDAIKQMKNHDIGIIYADPPYSRFHYSRYYHVLETICLRDNPKISLNVRGDKLSRGIYRKDRHQSPFSIRSKAFGAFEELFANASNIASPLILSYSPQGINNDGTQRLIQLNDIKELANRYYSDVRIVNIDKINHSKLNNHDNIIKDNTTEEILVICK